MVATYSRLASTERRIHSAQNPTTSPEICRVLGCLPGATKRAENAIKTSPPMPRPKRSMKISTKALVRFLRLEGSGRYSNSMPVLFNV